MKVHGLGVTAPSPTAPLCEGTPAHPRSPGHTAPSSVPPPAAVCSAGRRSTYGERAGSPPDSHGACTRPILIHVHAWTHMHAHMYAHSCSLHGTHTGMHAQPLHSHKYTHAQKTTYTAALSADPCMGVHTCIHGHSLHTHFPSTQTHTRSWHDPCRSFTPDGFRGFTSAPCDTWTQTDSGPGASCFAHLQLPPNAQCAQERAGSAMGKLGRFRLNYGPSQETRPQSCRFFLCSTEQQQSCVCLCSGD